MVNFNVLFRGQHNKYNTTYNMYNHIATIHAQIYSLKFLKVHNCLYTFKDSVKNFNCININKKKKIYNKFF